MDIAELQTKFFTAADPKPSTDAATVTMLLDGQSFGDALGKALDGVGTDADRAKNANDFIYIANWWLGLVGGDYVQAGRWGGGTSGGPHVVPWAAGLAEIEPPFSLDGTPGRRVIDTL